MTKLKIYKASAGSGKTFKLAEEYLLMVFKNPYAFKNILAVTFTNKATAEMKQRIIHNLYLLSTKQETPYRDIIMKELNYSDKQVETQAAKILKLILHDYSHFSLETIDSFFQKILRAFTKDVGFYSGFTVELDNSLVLEESIEYILKEKIKEDEKLKQWIYDFIQFRLKDEKGWNIRFELEKLGKEIFKESVQSIDGEFWDKISNKEYLRTYEKELNEIIYKFENQLIKYADEAIAIIENHQLSKTDFKGKSKSFVNIFQKLRIRKFDFPNDTTINAVDDIEKWYGSEKDKHDQILSAYNTGLNSILTNIIDVFKTKFIHYRTAKSIISNFYTLGIIADLSTEIRKITKEKNVFLLSDASFLLKSIIGNNDSPFIYEKTGTFFKSFMIDEFQDTSKLQWENFKPLIINSLAEGNNSLVVGDVKQSIYRWRNGDWTILGEQIPNNFDTNEINLNTNYRSLQQVVDFNNLLFSTLPNMLTNHFISKVNSVNSELAELSEKINVAYKKPEQLFIDSKAGQGYVELNFLDYNDYEENLIEKIPQTIIQLQDNGYEAKDIAILVRKNKEGQAIADMLLSYKKENNLNKYCFDIISNDSLFVKYSPAIQLIVSVLKYLENKDIKLTQYELLMNFYELKRDSKTIAILNDEYLDNQEIKNFIEFLPEEFQLLNEMKSYSSLFQLVEKIIDIFKISEYGDHNAYIISFLDIVSDFTERNYIDIPTFNEFWETNKNKYTIQAPDEINAIKILTIHKSKGLQFKAVIIPYMNWKIDTSRNDTIIWCKPNVKPFNSITIVPVLNTKTLENTIFAEEYFIEKLHTFIDNLNMLYVACTRAEETLITYTQNPKESKNKKEKYTTIGDLVHDFLEVSATDKKVNIDNHDQFKFGELISNQKPDKNSKEINFLKKYEVFDSTNRIKMALHSDAFFDASSSDKDNYIQYGNLMHNILAEIYTKEDVQLVIEDYVNRGEVQEKDKQDYIEKIENLISKPEVKNWYTSSYEIKNEAAILLRNGRIRRPDRIMIKGENAIVVDYKFTHEENLEYHMQVNTYVELLQKLGYKKVTGYLWYILLDKLVKI
jgi:ATP-dependent helicase/nuclease subunit A